MISRASHRKVLDLLRLAAEFYPYTCITVKRFALQVDYGHCRLRCSTACGDSGLQVCKSTLLSSGQPS